MDFAVSADLKVKKKKKTKQKKKRKKILALRAGQITEKIVEHKVTVKAVVIGTHLNGS